MAATTEQKVDFLLKKIGYVASKTGIAEDESSLSGTKKAPFAESIPSPLVTPSTSIWADASLIPSTPPGSDTSYVKVYLTGTSGVRMTVDNTVSGNRTFLARSTYGNDSSAILGDWIDTSFSADYIIKVFKGDPNSGGVQLSAAGAGSNDTWFFDYSSGVLNFNGTQIPSGVTSSNIYIVGYRYIGAKGGRPAAGIATFASLDVSGISTFRDDVNFISANGNNILFDKSDNALEFGDNVQATFGTVSGGDMQIYHNGSNSHIDHNGTGDLFVRTYGNGSDLYLRAANDVLIRPQTNEDGIKVIGNGAVELFYDNTKRFETTSTGAQVTGNLNVTGVLTYDDVTNIDSLGIVTARTGVDVNAGGINVDGGGLNIVGVSTFANDIIANGSIDLAGDIDVDGHTNLDNVNVAGVTTFAGNIDANGDLDVDGHTNLDNVSIAGITTMTGNLHVANNQPSIYLNDLDSENDYSLINNNGTFAIRDNDRGVNAYELLANGTNRFNGNVNFVNSIDVDGHTELDNVNISGLTTAALLNVSSLTDGRVTFASASGRLVDSANLTFDGTNLIAASAKITDLTSGRVVTAGTNGALQDSNNLTFNGSLLDVTGNLSVSGNVSIAGTLTYQDVTNVDSVGIATARVGIKVLAGGVDINAGGLDVVGVSTFNNNVSVTGMLKIPDGGSSSNRISVGDSEDLKIYHTGNNSTIKHDNGSGDLYLDSLATGSDIHLRSEAEFAVQVGGNNHIQAYKNGGTSLSQAGSKKLETLSTGARVTGTLDVTSGITVAGNIDANGNIDVAGTSVFNDDFKLVGSVASSYILWDKSANTLDIRDNIPIRWGTGNDFSIQHTSNHTQLYNSTGAIVIRNQAQDSDISIQGNDGGSIITMLGFDASESGNATFSGDIKLTDAKKIKLGAADDLTLQHTFINNSWNGVINNATNVLFIESDNITFRGKGSTESLAAFLKDGHVSLYYDNTVRFQTSGIGVTVTGETKTTTLNVTGITTTNNLNVTGTATIASIGSTIGISSNFYFGDSKKLYFGDGDDLHIEHNGNSFITGTSGYLQIRNTGGYTYIDATTFRVRGSNGSGNLISATQGAQVELNHAGNIKLATTVGGINVTGTTDTDNFVNAGVSTFVGIITASAVGNVIPFLFNNYSDLPAASSYHGAFAHVHTVAKGFFAHAGNWVEIVSKEADGRVGSGTETYNIKDLNVVGVSTFNSHVNLLDNDILKIGTGSDFTMNHNGSHTYLENSTGDLIIDNNGDSISMYAGTGMQFRVNNNEQAITATANGAVELYFDNAKKIETKIYGVDVTGTTTTDGLVVSGVSTFAGGSFSGNISAVDGTFSGNVSIAGTLTYQDVTNIDSVGIVTARTDLHVGTGATVIKTVSGQVGINSTIPAHMLDVGGVINSSTDVRVNNESLVTQNQALNDAVAMAIALG